MSVTSVEAPAAFVGSVAQRIEHFPAHRVTCGPGLSNRLFPDRVPHAGGEESCYFVTTGSEVRFLPDTSP
jgi:hypothetical protein